MSRFKALVIDKAEDGTVTQSFEMLDDTRLPADGEVTVAVEYSTVN